MKLLLDMNLSPEWVRTLESGGWEAIHWHSTGNPSATDNEVMAWARKNGYVVFTHDLDFGMLLAATQASGPSVIQIRTQDVMPTIMKDRIFEVLGHYKDQLERGALITVDESKSRIRILPLF